jgi:hypothetical protein
LAALFVGKNPNLETAASCSGGFCRVSWSALWRCSRWQVSRWWIGGDVGGGVGGDVGVRVVNCGVGWCGWWCVGVLVGVVMVFCL